MSEMNYEVSIDAVLQFIRQPVKRPEILKIVVFIAIFIVS